MRGSVVVGVLLLLAGAFVLTRGFSFTKDKTVLDMGPIQASVSEKQAVPPWVGGIAVAAGVALIAVGASKASR
jgi:hypothetical protein